MKHYRRVSVVLLLFVILLSSCGTSGQNSAQITAQNGEFSCTPDKIVELINGMVESQKDDVLLSLDAYEASGETIHSSDRLGRLLVTLEEAESGNLSTIQLYWESASNDESVITSAAAYCSVLLNNMIPEQAEDVSDRIRDIMGSGYGEEEFSYDGVSISFQSLSGLNWLDIDAAQ